jgi:hypothetical protein
VLATLPQNLWAARRSSLDHLQDQLDSFLDECNHRRLPHQATAYTTRPKAVSGKRNDTHNRVRTDRVDDTTSASAEPTPEPTF